MYHNQPRNNPRMTKFCQDAQLRRCIAAKVKYKNIMRPLKEPKLRDESTDVASSIIRTSRHSQPARYRSQRKKRQYDSPVV